MEIDKLLQYLRCRECSSHFERHAASTLTCPSCKKGITLIHDVPYFDDIPDNIVLKNLQKDSTDQARWSIWRKKNFDFLCNVLQEIQKPSVFIDIGAGQGNFKQLFSEVNTCLALDFYPYHGIDVVCNFSQGIPLIHNFADIILLSNVLEHMSEPYKLLKECRKILVPEGTLIIMVPFMMKVHQSPYDFYRYTQFGLDYLLLKAGYNNIQIFPIGDMFDIITQYNKPINKLYQTIDDRVAKFPLRITMTFWQFFMNLTIHRMKNLIKSNPYEQSLPLGYGCIARK